MRVPQPEGTRGSLKWMQRAVALRPDLLQPRGIAPIRWLSPRVQDSYAEYRDGAFLDCLGLPHLKDALSEFWPARGPQWDALGRAGDVRVLVEAKAHIDEFLSPPTQAGDASRRKIEAALGMAKSGLNVRDDMDWAGPFYQFTNRIAHLWWLRSMRVDAHLLFVDFLHDDEMGGPKHQETWQAAYDVASYALALPRRHEIWASIHHVYPDVRALTEPSDAVHTATAD